MCQMRTEGKGESENAYRFKQMWDIVEKTFSATFEFFPNWAAALIKVKQGHCFDNSNVDTVVSKPYLSGGAPARSVLTQQKSSSGLHLVVRYYF